MASRLACRIGLHRWRLFPQAASWYAMFRVGDPEANLVSRRCSGCGRMQCTTDGGEVWSERA